MKECSACHRQLDDEQFYKTHYGKLSSRCKPCTRIQVKEWKAKNPETVKLHDAMKRIRNAEQRREYSRKYYQLHPEVAKAAAIRAKLKFPDKERARSILRNYIKSGRIIRPTRCTVCGEKNDRIEGHHPDYSKPLAVIWTCQLCHRGLEKKAA